MVASLRCFGMLLATIGLFTLPSTASADVILSFSDATNNFVPPADLPVEVTFSLDGAQLHVTVDNQSLYRIKSLFINTDETLSGLAFSGLNSPEVDQWFVDGSGAIQAIDSDGFGFFNWLLHFGDDFLLPPSTVSTFTLDLTGTTAEDTIGGKHSINSPTVPALAAALFIGGDSSSVGASFTSAVVGGPDPNPVPAPAALPLVLIGGAVLLGRRSWFTRTAV